MPETVIIQNPQSGSGDHADSVRNRAEVLGYGLERTEEAGDAIALAQRAAAAGASTVVAAGGDGTVNEVLNGIGRADAFDDVTLAVLPLGTGNNFAKQIGVPDLEAAFDVLAAGRRRRIDVGQANDWLFVNSCVGGLTADSSSETSAEMKSRLGVLAYVVTTLQSVSDFESLRVRVEIDDGAATAFDGEALVVLVGNGRRFTTGGSSQANMEDGRFDVTVIEDESALDLMSDALGERLLGAESEHVVRTQTDSLTLSVQDPDTIRFSLDGEIIQERELDIECRPRTLSVAVGDSYRPDPDQS